MLKVCGALFCWHLMICGVLAERTNKRHNRTELSIVEKQHDYKINFERVELARFDKRYVKFVDVVTFKYNRTSPLVNLTYVYNVDVGYDLELITQAYRFASNEYRPFPIRFQFNFCEAFDKNVLGLEDFRKCGTLTGCPLVKDKKYHTCNWSINPAMFPPLIPNGQYMLEIQMVHRSVELFAVHGYGTVFRPIVV